jgi:hypothetical protein
MKTEYFLLSSDSQETTVTDSSYIIALTCLFLQSFLTQLYGVFLNVEKNLESLCSQDSAVRLFSRADLFNNSVEWLNQLILSCVSVLVLRGGTLNVAL